ncbi:MAG TPA: hypothetical protein DEP66_05895, partial [Acidimicrobiaceae bacterium]|nr:hypothetical protein [Acidimicrobiaceae bacterium]
QVTEKIVELQNRTWMDGFMGVFSYAGMPADEAQRNMSLFAARVMPELKALAPVDDRLGMAA